jgi:hypothetical protein
MEPNLSTIFRQDEVIKVTGGEVAWDIYEIAPDLVGAIAAAEPIIPALCQELRRRVPIVRTRRAMESPPFERPIGHGRSYYLRLADLPGARSAAGCLAVKGTEVLCDDYWPWIQQMRNDRVCLELLVGDVSAVRGSPYAEISQIDRWPIVERKVPGVLTFAEASGEAQIAFDFQSAHARRYGAAARVPFPLLVYRWPESLCKQLWDKMRPLLASRSVPVVESSLRDGLGAYVYYYPTVPLRLNHLELEEISLPAAAVGRRFAYRKRAQGLAQAKLDPQLIIGRWMELFVRMLCVGFLPKDPTSFLTADCLQSWNMVLDGGMVDIDSLKPAGEVIDDREFYDIVRRSVRELTIDVSRMLLGTKAIDARFRDRLPEVYWIVMNDLQRRFIAENQRAPIDPRLLRFFHTSDAFADLDGFFAMIFPEAGQHTQW